ncbi:FecR family protein [Pseudomonas putida]
MTDARVLREAVEWLLRFDHQPPGEAHRRSFEAWLANSPAHRDAWRAVNGVFEDPLANLTAVEARSPGQVVLASQVLAGPLSRRRFLGGGLATLLVGAGAVGVGVGERMMPLGQLWADVRTATGVQARRTLPDGSRLTLNARSAADLDFALGVRSLHLREGALFVQVAHAGAQPLSVATAHGQLSSHEGQIMVRLMPDHTLVNVMQGQVQMVSRSGAAAQGQTGQIVRMDDQGSRLGVASVWSRADWLEGRADLRDEPLGDLLEVLRPYHEGWLRISPQAARVHAYGSFLLSDLSRTLNALQDTLPLSVSRFGPWLTRIELKNV